MEEYKGFLVPNRGFATKAIHVGQSPKKWRSAAVVPPIITSVTFELPTPGVPDALPPPYYYGRCGNPTRDTLEECLASLEGAKYASTFASGLAAISSIISLLKNEDHMVSGDDIYGGTSVLFRQIVSEMGIDTTFVNLTDDLTNFKNAIKKNTKLIWMESPTNPTMKLVDISAVVDIVKSINSEIIVVVDNTFLTPYLQRPLDFGADIVVYSLTKYMNGHSDVVMGAVLTNNDEIGEKLKFIQTARGAVPSPIDCYLVNRGLKTLPLRMEQHKKSSLIIAQWLEKHSKIIELRGKEKTCINVFFEPSSLPSHPQHELAKKQSSGHSGMLSFRHIGTLVESQKFLNALEIIIHATSLGGFVSLAQLPSLISHKDVPGEQRVQLGITDSLIRMTIGLEDIDDLLQDLEQALDAAFK